MSKKELLQTELAELADSRREEAAAEVVFNAAEEKAEESKQKLFSRFFAEGGLRLQWAFNPREDVVKITLTSVFVNGKAEEVDLREYHVNSEVGSTLAAIIEKGIREKCEFLSELRRLKALALDRTFISFVDDSIYEFDGEKWEVVYDEEEEND